MKEESVKRYIISINAPYEETKVALFLTEQEHEFLQFLKKALENSEGIPWLEIDIDLEWREQ